MFGLETFAFRRTYEMVWAEDVKHSFIKKLGTFLDRAEESRSTFTDRLQSFMIKLGFGGEFGLLRAGTR